MALKGLEKNTRSILQTSGQEHLMEFYDDLQDAATKERFLRSLLTIDFDEMSRLFQRANCTSAGTNGEQLLDELMEPLVDEIEAEERCAPEVLQSYYERGLLEIARGRVGVILMAGGQGSRLGVSYPKGMYNVGLLSNKTLFQIQAERILKVEELAFEKYNKKGHVVWYIMTSGPTYDDTATFLKKNNYFGLKEENVVLFKQGLLPCFTFEGKILLNGKDQMALAPDGNGGIYKALEVNGILDDFQKRGVQYLHCHSVDNILVKVADPWFVGYCVEKGADCGAKVVQKNSPTECVGVLCRVQNKIQVVEYSEITDETAHLLNADGTRTFNAGNICNHFFTASFLRKIAMLDMPLHVAKKKIPYLNEQAQLVTPPTPNGIKIEKFVFDVFAFSDKFVAWEVPRDTEFSALKNADSAGKDCPKTAKDDLYRLHRKYLGKIGAIVDGAEIEISPAVSYAGEGLAHLQGQTIASPFLLK